MLVGQLTPEPPCPVGGLQTLSLSDQIPVIHRANGYWGLHTFTCRERSQDRPEALTCGFIWFSSGTLFLNCCQLSLFGWWASMFVVVVLRTECVSSLIWGKRERVQMQNNHSCCLEVIIGVYQCLGFSAVWGPGLVWYRCLLWCETPQFLSLVRTTNVGRCDDHDM